MTLERLYVRQDKSIGNKWLQPCILASFLWQVISHKHHTTCPYYPPSVVQVIAYDDMTMWIICAQLHHALLLWLERLRWRLFTLSYIIALGPVTPCRKSNSDIIIFVSFFDRFISKQTIYTGFIQANFCVKNTRLGFQQIYSHLPLPAKIF